MGTATVVDGGQRRRPEIDHDRGIGRLRTVTACSRRRTTRWPCRPTTARNCIRVWYGAATSTGASMSHQRSPPPICRACARRRCWGVIDSDDLPWLDPPPPIVLESARAELWAQPARSPAPPHRSGRPCRARHRTKTRHTLVCTRTFTTHPGAIATAAKVAAILGDSTPSGRMRSADLRSRVDHISVSQPSADRWRTRLDPEGVSAAADSTLTGLIVAVTHPNRISSGADGPSYLLASGGSGAARIAVWGESRTSSQKSIQRWRRTDRDRNRSPSTRSKPSMPTASKTLMSAGDRRARDVILNNKLAGANRHPSPQRLHRSKPSEKDFRWYPSRRARSTSEPADVRLRDRPAVHTLHPDAWPDVSDDALLERLEDWVGPAVDRRTRRADLERLVRDHDLARLAPRTNSTAWPPPTTCWRKSLRSTTYPNDLFWRCGCKRSSD